MNRCQQQSCCYDSSLSGLLIAKIVKNNFSVFLHFFLKLTLSGVSKYNRMYQWMPYNDKAIEIWMRCSWGAHSVHLQAVCLYDHFLPNLILITGLIILVLCVFGLFFCFAFGFGCICWNKWSKNTFCHSWPGKAHDALVWEKVIFSEDLADVCYVEDRWLEQELNHIVVQNVINSLPFIYQRRDIPAECVIYSCLENKLFHRMQHWC